MMKGRAIMARPFVFAGSPLAGVSLYSMRCKTGDFLLDLQLFLLEFCQLKIINAGRALHHLDMVREGLVLFLQFLQMRTQAHDLPPAG
jgi:hypothetical protein